MNDFLTRTAMAAEDNLIVSVMTDKKLDDKTRDIFYSLWALIHALRLQIEAQKIEIDNLYDNKRKRMH